MSKRKVKCIKPKGHRNDSLWGDFHDGWVYELGFEWGSFWVGERGCDFDDFDNEERLWRVQPSDNGALHFETRTGMIFKVVG